MVEHLRYFNFIDECFFAIFLRKGGLLSEGFNGYLSLISEADSQIDSGKVTLSESFFSFEQIVKIKLIHKVLKLSLPLLNILGVITVELHGLIIGADETDARWCTEEFFLGLILRPDDLEDSVEGDHEAPLGGLAVYWMIEDCFGSKHEYDWLGVVAFEIERGAEDRIGGEQLVVLFKELSFL